MARQQGIKVENAFVNGLVTENTALSFPENAATETYDCVFDKTGRVKRRLGFDVEGSNKLASIAHTDGDAIVEFLWEVVAGEGTKSFFVIQTSNLLRFYDVSTSSDLKDNVESFTVDLDGFVPVGTSLDPATNPCQFAAGNGDLIVVNPACDPIFVSYDSAADDIDANAITLKKRDLSGVPDGLELAERPTESEATLATNNPAHYYNLHNQGWFTEALDQWDTSRTDMPNNSEVVAYYRNDAGDPFAAGNVTGRTNFSNSRAPRGHFILDVFAPDRVAACNAEAEETIAAGTSDVSISGATGSRSGMDDLDDNTSKVFDGDRKKTSTTMAHKNNATTLYIGKDFGSTPKVITKARLWPSTSGFVDSATPNTTISLRGANTLPTNFASDGTELGSQGATADPSTWSVPTEITSSDTSTKWQYVWVYMTHDGAANDFGMGELQFFTSIPTGGESLDVDEMSTTARPSTVAFYGERVWYAGTDDVRHNSNLYFSRLVKSSDDYGKCFQLNDPSDEDVFDLLASDGGVIKIPEIGTVTKLYTYQDSLLVFATNGVWQIKGGTGGFAADDFLVRKISEVGCNAPLSIVSVKGIPLYWTDDGISTITYELETDSFSSKSLTDEKIKTFITDIPEYNRRWVKSAYDQADEKVYFLYNTSTTQQTDNEEYAFNAVLVADTRTQAFYPWTIGDNDLIMRGMAYVRVGDRSSDSKMKFVIMEPVDASNEKIGYAQVDNTLYKDWTQYSIDVADSTQEIDYTSYFDVGYYVHGEASKRFQPTYVHVFMEVEDYASLKMRGQFDFANNADSGQYSTLQQCYHDCGNANLAFKKISVKRMKVRGRGRSLSLHFESESEKPFTLIGWSTYETSNAAV